MTATKTKDAERGGQEFTAQPLIVPSNNGAMLKDSEFFRLPRPKARCPLSGLSRTSILENGESGCFKMIRLRKRGSQRGIVLVETSSFLRWLHGQPALTKEAQP